MLTTLLLVVAIIAVLAMPYVKTNLSDVSPVALENQSSVGPTRENSESAIYRSVDVPNGMPLTGGMGIRIGYRLRDGNLKDIWNVALGGAKTVIEIAGKEYTIPWINGAIHTIGTRLTEITEKGTVAIFSDFDSPESIWLLLSCFFVAEKTVVNLNSLPESPLEGVDLVLVDQRHAMKVSKMGFKNVVTLDKSSPLFALDNVSPSTEFKYVPDKEYMDFNNQCYSEVNDSELVKFYQRSFVSSIAARLRSLPADFVWNETDSVLVLVESFSHDSKNNLLMTLLGALVEQVAKITIVSDGSVESLDQVAKYNATILSAGDRTLARLVTAAVASKSVISRLCLSRAETFNSEGIFNGFGKLSLSTPLRLKVVYSRQTDKPLPSRQYNTIRSALGARIVRETYHSFAMGPLLKTNIYDYRVVSGGSKITELGVAANSLELKIKKKTDDAKTGVLHARGFSLGKGDKAVIDDQMWVGLGLEGWFARDGCFYVVN